ncbi:type II secretion system protein [bacterium]|nr:type II secretion system protein [bacterium]
MNLKLRRSQHGTSLIEVMVSLSIMSIVMGTMTPAYVKFMKLNNYGETYAGAVAAAQKKLDNLRFLNPSTLPTTGSTGPEAINAGERSYQVTTFYCRDNSLCTSTEVRHLTVEVTYKNELLFTASTVYARLN